tara:strand:- start:1012 stop:1452 length:441 start_codon:yes stop_codon:yes gene_type:complete
MKTNKTWKLPLPEKMSSGLTWFPVVRVGRVVPFGYEQDPSDQDILLPVTEELEALEIAKNHLRQYSYRDVAIWLSEQTGRSISHVGLMKRVKLERKRKTDAENALYYAQRYKEAEAKAKRLQEKRIFAVEASRTENRSSDSGFSSG